MRRLALGAGKDAKERQTSPRVTSTDLGRHPEAKVRTCATPRRSPLARGEESR